MRFDWLTNEELDREIALMRHVIAESKVNATVRHAKWALQKAEASWAGRGAAASPSPALAVGWRTRAADDVLAERRRRRDLVRAGALILAEIERLDRLPASPPPTEARS